MKSPADIGERLARQWQNSRLRAQRLLEANAWPLYLPIGKPSARRFAENTAAVQGHVDLWKAVAIGDVKWELINYRAGAEPIRIPTQWILRSPSEWVAASGELDVKREFARLEYLVEHVNAEFHELLVRQRALWREKPDRDIIDAAQLAASLQPGCAAGKPLRLLSGTGVDTKFFERNGTLLTRLLDERFDGTASEQGLAGFLDATEDKEHWLLIVPLQRELLTFSRQRIPASHLAETPLPAANILIVENEHCVHLLPSIPDTIAVLGSGHNLTWMKAPWLDRKRIAYWGDMDSWGLLMLARARECQPDLTSLLMRRELFDTHTHGNAVCEPTSAGDIPPAGLMAEEKSFYRYLINLDRGRLEQEYIPKDVVDRELAAWAGSSVTIL